MPLQSVSRVFYKCTHTCKLKCDWHLNMRIIRTQDITSVAGVSIRYLWNILWRFTWRHIMMLSAEVTSLGYRLFSFSEYEAIRSYGAMGPATTLDLWARTDFRPRLACSVSTREVYTWEDVAAGEWMWSSGPLRMLPLPIRSFVSSCALS